MKSIFYFSLIILGFWNIVQIVRADHCDAKHDVTLAPPKIDDKNYKPPVDEERDSCSLSYLSILNPDESPTADDGCVIRGFHLKDGSVGPSCIPEIGKLPRHNFFSINMESHRKEAKELFEVFFKCSTFEDFKNAALYYKSKVNPMLFSFVFSTAIMNRPDSKNFPSPNLHQIKPDLFFNDKIIDKAKQKLNKKVKRSRKSHEKAKYLESENKRPKMYHHHPRPSENEIPPMGAENHAPIIKIPPNDLQNSPKYFTESPAPKEPENGVEAENPEYHEAVESLPENDVEAAKPEYHENVPSSPPESAVEEQENDDLTESPIFKIKRNINRKLPFIAAPEEKEIIEEDQPETMNENNPEYKMTYFREDITLNSHHNQFHVIYPSYWDASFGLRDRKGEFFYYMHNQMIKRYNGDRMAVELKSVEPLNITESDTIIEDGYYPHLSAGTTGASYSGRSRHLKLRNVNRDDFNIKISNVIKCTENIIHAINDGHIVDEYGNKLPLDEKHGIDLLGSIVESSSYSKNRALYGDIHNQGHLLLSYIHDYNGQFHAPPSVMYHSATAVRDPVFWRWHKMVDNLLNLHKAKLPPYSDKYLTWKEIKIINIAVQSYPNNDIENEGSYPPNSCYTYFTKQQIDISRGLDFNANQKVVRVNIQHLDHLPFKYVIEVNSLSKQTVEGHVRIFISPRRNDNHKLATDEELRRNAIEMDRFTVKLKHGKNTLHRNSEKSAVTLLPGRQWASISDSDVDFSNSGNNNEEINKDGGCGCGWPHHLLVPRGTSKGIQYVLFVMISNWSQEKEGNPTVYRSCDSSLTMCGLFGKKFPDKRPMGFPLDRPIHNKNWFKRPNMIKKVITIYQKDLR